MTCVTDSEQRVESFRSGHSGRVLITLATGSLILFLGRLVLPPLLPEITRELAMTSAHAGLGLSVMWLLMALTQYPSGRFSDNYSRKLTISLGLLSGMAGFVLLYFSSSYHTFLLSVGLVGVGAGFFTSSVFAKLADVFEARRGQAFGINSASSDLGGALTAALVALAFFANSWRVVILPIIGTLLLVLYVYTVVDDEHTFGGSDPTWVGAIAPRISSDLNRTRRRLLVDSRLQWTIVSLSLFMFVWQGVTSFFPTFLVVSKGFSPSLSSQVFSGLFVIGIVIKPYSGRLGDRLSYRAVGLAAAFASSIGLAILTVANSSALLALSIVVMSMGFASFLPVMNTLLINEFPDGSMGGDFGASRSIFLAVGSLGSSFVGLIADVFGFTVAFLGLSLLSAANVIVLAHYINLNR